MSPVSTMVRKEAIALAEANAMKSDRNIKKRTTFDLFLTFYGTKVEIKL